MIVKEFFPGLRDANVKRAIEWSNGGDGGQFYAIEFFGEAGEALNLVKKLEREKLGMVGSRSTLAELADELADVVICIDLLAIAFGLGEVYSVKSEGHREPLQEAVALGRCAGAVMGYVESLEQEAMFYHEYSSLEVLAMGLANAQMFVIRLGRSYGINLDDAVVTKFNKTSTKYGLTTMLEPNGDA